MPFPPRPTNGQRPWFATRDTWDQYVEEAVDRLAAQHFDPRDFGAVFDGVTDDGPALTACYDAAAAVDGSNQQYCKAIVDFPARSTARVATSIAANFSQIHTEGNGARLLGPITGAGRITNSTPIPDADDIAGQTAGACFIDNRTLDQVVYWPSFSDLVIDNFRFGFVSKCFSWSHPVFDNIEFRNTDIGYFAYQGCQEWTIIDPGLGWSSHSLIAAGATCFTAAHPLAGLDNYMVDGLRIRNERQTINPTLNADVDNWFEAAILRPASTSVAAGGSTTFDFTGTARKVTGRAYYTPQRNRRGQYGWKIGPLNVFAAPRGHGLLYCPYFSHFHDLSGENLWGTATEELQSLIVVLIRDTLSTAKFSVINANDAAAFGASFKGAIDVVAGTTQTNTAFVAELVNGWVDPYFFAGIQMVESEAGGLASRRTAFTAPAFFPVTAASSQAFGADLFVEPTGPSLRVESAGGQVTLTTVFESMLPLLPGGAETGAKLNLTGEDPPLIKGADAEFRVTRMDTGETETGTFKATLSGRYATNTLAFGISVSDTTMTLNGDGIAFTPGTPILVNGTEKYQVKSHVGNTLTLVTPVTVARASGTTVAGLCAVTGAGATLTWATAAMDGRMFKITNTIAPVQIDFSVVFEHIEPRFT